VIALTPGEQVLVDHFGIFEDDSLPMSIRLIADAERAEAAAEAVRARLAPAPTGGMVKAPDEMIDDLEWAKYGSGRIALVLKDASLAVRRARDVFARAHAAAVLGSGGKSEQLREADAALACADEQAALDVAEVALEFAKNVARSVEQSGSMTQTQASLVKAQMALAGTGREG
jgi:hypothetical protein